VNRSRSLYPNEHRSKALILVLMRNFNFVALLAVLDHAAIEVIVVHLKKDVVIHIYAVEYPLQRCPLLSNR